MPNGDVVVGGEFLQARFDAVLIANGASLSAAVALLGERVTLIEMPAAWTAAVISFTIGTSAFLAEIWRGCIQAVPKGQWEPAKALALDFKLTLALVVLAGPLTVAIFHYGEFSAEDVRMSALALAQHVVRAGRYQRRDAAQGIAGLIHDRHADQVGPVILVFIGLRQRRAWRSNTCVSQRSCTIPPSAPTDGSSSLSRSSTLRRFLRISAAIPFPATLLSRSRQEPS